MLPPLGVAEHHAAARPARVSIGGEISPVNAPSGSWCMFCAYTSTRDPRALSTIARRSVNGTQIATSTPSTADTRGSSAWMYSSACASVLCIFQLPAISGVRPAVSDATPAPSSACTPGQRRALDQLAASRRRRSRGGRPRAPGRSCASAAAESPPPTTVRPCALRDRLGHRARARRERLELERAHRPVPEDRARARDLARVALGGLRADVQAHPARRHLHAVAARDARRPPPARSPITRSLGSSAARAAGRGMRVARARSARARVLGVLVVAQRRRRPRGPARTGTGSTSRRRSSPRRRPPGSGRSRRSCPPPWRRRRPPPAAARGARGSP